MLAFYKKSILMLCGLLAVTSVLALAVLNRVFVRDALLPAGDSAIPWKLETLTDVQKGGTSSISVNESVSRLDYDYVLTREVEYPHVTAVIAFDALNDAAHWVNLGAYSTATLRIRCTPHNLLAFHLHSFDPLVTDSKNFSSYRIAEALFSCHEDWSAVEIDLRHLTVPAWWLQTFKADISDQSYFLDKVIGFSIGASRQGPVNVPAKVQIAGLVLQGRDWRYAWFFAGLLFVTWSGCGLWLFRLYTRCLVAHVRERLRQDRPLIAHQQLSAEPRTDHEKNRLLRFIATEYADPGLSLEKTVASVGINRIKINAILRQELGLTFTAYLNKLRLTEAARLLSENATASVAEIAFSVGYNNVPYFNKLFKEEYGCSPTTFKKIRSRTPAADAG